MKIGFIGTGHIGNPMARHLIEGGHQLTVHDLMRDATTNLEELGATWAPTVPSFWGVRDMMWSTSILFGMTEWNEKRSLGESPVIVTRSPSLLL